MSDRKSELRLNIEDFCSELPENSDPIIANLLAILEWEASLDIETNSVLHKVFVSQIDELKCKLRLELKHVNNKTTGIETHNNNISKLIADFHKLKQVFSYCLILTKKKSTLAEELQKFNLYVPKEINLTEELETCLNEPVIFETIFQNYLRIYNVNIFSADLISFLYSKHQQRLLVHTGEEKVSFKRWSNPDIERLQSQSIIFKELTDINKKYTDQRQKLKSSYISFLCNDPLEMFEPNENIETDRKGEQENTLKDKVKVLEEVLSKIKKEPGLFKNEKSSLISLEPEPFSNLAMIEVSASEESCKIIESNKQFFIDTLYGKTWSDIMVGDEEFLFMKEKIIKVETLFFLNRILSAVNVICHIYNQLDLENKQNFEFSFKNLRKLIGSEFITKTTFSCNKVSKEHKSSFISIDSLTKSYMVTDSHNTKLLYPSAVNYFFSFIKNMLSTNFEQKENLIQTLEAKSEYYESLAETIVNIYQIIKVKQLSCYKLLREYIEIIQKSSCWNNLSIYNTSEELIRAVCKEKQKIGIISQIIYEFDHNYSIKEALEELLRIEFDGLTRNCTSTFLLYEAILSEIIQTRNGLKLDHYYSVNQIHEIFSLLPKDMEKSDDKKEKVREDLYFEDIIHEICTASHTNLYLPKLFFFLDLQLNFKRIIFKLELCWSGHQEFMFDRKTQAFKDFINTHCSPIFDIINECHSIVEILEKLEDIERYIEILAKEVERFYLAEKMIEILGNFKNELAVFTLRDQVSRLGMEKLNSLNTIVSVFNPIEAQNVSNINNLVEIFCKNITILSTIKLEENSKLNPALLKEKERLSSIIVITSLLSGRNSTKDHQNYIELHRNASVHYDLYQIKQNELLNQKYYEWLTSDNVESLIKFNEDLLVMSILKTLRELEENELEASQDFNHLEKLMSQFELSKTFLNLNSIEEIQLWRDEFGIMTKYHQVYQLMFNLDCFNSQIYGNSDLKVKYKSKGILNHVDHTVNFNYKASSFITKLHYIFKISPLTRLKLQRNVQYFEKEVLEVESVYRNALGYHEKLKKQIYLMLCSEIQRILEKCDLTEEISLCFDGTKEPKEYIDSLKKLMYQVISGEFARGMKKDGFGKFREIEMFREKKGFELPILEQKDNKDYKIATKKYGERAKKPVIEPHRLQEEKTKPIENLKRKFKIDMLKNSIKLRKEISKLQLNENRIRDEIIWETSKLEYSVIEKINQFISLSNVDQQQSYINFKHTVNLETIKGIENVIEEQTEMYMEKKNAPLEEHQDAFLTGVEEEGEEIVEKVDKKARLLESNVNSIVEHMRKIRIFSAWKKVMKKTDLTKKEWVNFNVNVQNILNNDKIVQSLGNIEEARNGYLRQNVTCEIMKEENSKINEKIQELKIDNLEKKVKNYREYLLRS